MKKAIKLIILFAASAVGVWMLLLKDPMPSFTAHAMPAWARKYNADCTLCHTTYPRLNRTGYEFRRRGYRFEWETDKSAVKPDTSAVSYTPASYTPASVSDSSRAGELLYKKLDCASCHTIKGQGASVGPTMDGVGARRTRQFLIDHMADPEKHAKKLPMDHPQGSSMPAVNATADELAKLADYILTLPAIQGESRRKTRVTDYLAVLYGPNIEIEREDGATKRKTDARGLVFFAAGPVGRNFSFFVQPIPLSTEKGILGKFEMAQGLLNFGGNKNFVQLRGGQLYNLRNTGFGGTDRGLSDSLPFIFQPVNGFNPSSTGRGGSVEVVLNRTSSFKLFGISNSAVESEAEGTVFDRSKTYGFIYEKVLGKKSLSGVSFEFAGGRTPYSLDGVRQESLHFERYSFFANKSFLDKHNFERVNTMFGFSLIRDNRFLGLAETVNNEVTPGSRGYGYFIETSVVPVPKHLAVFARYDQLRPTNLALKNTLFGATGGIIFDPVRYARVLFEYQRQYGARRVEDFRISLQFNY